LSRQGAQSAERRFAWIVQLTKRITNVPFANPILRETIQGLEKKNRAIKRMLGDELVENRSDDDSVTVFPQPEGHGIPPRKIRLPWPFRPVPSPPTITIEEGETDTGQSHSLGARKSIERSGCE